MIFRNKNMNKMVIGSIFIIFFIFFNLIKQKEMRFLIILYPYMYLLISFSLFYFFDYFKSKVAKNTIITIIMISLILSSITTRIYYKNESGKVNQYAIFQDKLEKISSNVKIWISNPIVAVFSDKKIDNLIYYPVFNEAKKNELITGTFNFVFLDPCNLVCKPLNIACKNNKSELLTYFKKESKTIYFSRTGQCEQFIFSK